MRSNPQQQTPQQIAETNQLLSERYTAYNSADSSNSKFNILYSIIDIKTHLGLDVCKEVKKCVKLYIEASDEQGFGYDFISVEKVVHITSTLSLQEKERIFKTFSIYLEEIGLEEEKKHTEETIEKVKLQKIMSKRFFWLNPFFYIALIGCRPGWAIGLIILFLFAIEYLFLLPAFLPSWATVKFAPPSYTSSVYTNTLIAIPAMLLDIDDELKVKPIKWAGALAIIVAKSFFVLFVVNFLVKKLSENTKFKQ